MTLNYSTSQEVNSKMPVALTDNSVRFPTGFAPWYVYKATLVASPNTFEYGDVLLADASGTFDLDVSVGPGDLNLVGGYAMALEPFVTGMTEVQVAVPGSVFPAVAGTTSIQPEELVKISSALGVQTIIPASNADFAGGESLGRYRNQHFNNEILVLTATDDIINVLTGVA